MAVREITLHEWNRKQRPFIADPKGRLNGVSPGAAAARLGVTRQSVHKAINRGDLDAVRVVGEEGRLVAVLVLEDSLTGYQALREVRSR